eukprot:CAMPEP_0119137156 /NCGR_PEP_ID=MMETSP1310-20130426/23043_1 /TAXON_ID=464262 /ORGANISM="Genus nov. species nov., Strain RCC2339" /LENGTH=238 /DNA_ID=CAMNT_0007128219 /DNA_START=206 /DNA_END=919 /DNA_ORIENTATION=+
MECGSGCDTWGEGVMARGVDPGGKGCVESGKFKLKWRCLFRTNLSLFTTKSMTYLLGVQLAKLLDRKTFNMYRCMKKKNIVLRRATHQEVEFLCASHAVRTGTHSVTLVPFADALYFVADAIYRNVRLPNEPTKVRRRASYVRTRPPLHRRKPFPWDVQRSIRKESFARNETTGGECDADMRPATPPATPHPSPALLAVAAVSSLSLLELNQTDLAAGCASLPALDEAGAPMEVDLPP